MPHEMRHTLSIDISSCSLYPTAVIVAPVAYEPLGFYGRYGYYNRSESFWYVSRELEENYQNRGY